MVLKATVQKQSSKQLLRKVSPEGAARKIGTPKNFATGNHLCWSLFFIEFQAAPFFSCEYSEFFRFLERL